MNNPSFSINQRDQLFLIITTQNIIDQMIKIFYSINLCIQLVALSKNNKHITTEECCINDYFIFPKNGDLYNDIDSKKNLPDGVYTLNSLVIALTSEKGINLMKPFWATYKAFATPHKLFDKFMERYNVPLGQLSNASAIQIRVANALKYWLENHFKDLDEHLLVKIAQFIENQLREDYFNISNILEKTFLNFSRKQDPTIELVVLQPLPYFIKEQRYDHFIDLLIRHSPVTICQQLTLIDWEYFTEIEKSELLDKPWLQPDFSLQAIKVHALINRINNLSYWVASTILAFANASQRISIMKKFCKIAEELKNVNNLSSLAGVVGGFNLAAINRLNQTKSLLGRKYLKFLDEMKSLFDPSASYKNYRTYLLKLSSPTIPYIGVSLSELALIDEGNPDHVQEGLINFAKFELVYRAMNEIDCRQQCAYSYPKQEPLYTYLLSLPCFDDDQLYELSIQREQR